jgi:hypothetical protein
MPKLSTAERLAVFAAVAAQLAHLRGAEYESVRLGIPHADIAQRAQVLEDLARKLPAVLS